MAGQASSSQNVFKEFLSSSENSKVSSGFWDPGVPDTPPNPAILPDKAKARILLGSNLNSWGRADLGWGAGWLFLGGPFWGKLLGGGPLGILGGGLFCPLPLGGGLLGGKPCGGKPGGNPWGRGRCCWGGGRLAAPAGISIQVIDSLSQSPHWPSMTSPSCFTLVAHHSTSFAEWSDVHLL